MEIPREFYKKHRHELTQYISAEAYDGIIFITFVRGQKQVVVQFKLDDFISSSDRERGVINGCVWPWVNEIAKYPKEISWIPSAGNWCYISRSQKRGHLIFNQRDKEVDRMKVKEQPWARLIPEEDIDFEEIGPMDFRFGKWRGREVDVYKVWMDRDLPLLDRAMRAYRRLQDTNLTYDLIGHLIDSSGSLVGLVTEPMLGRAISLYDAPLVFSALQELNSTGYILDTPHEGSMLITASGELRVTAVQNVFQLPEDLEEREAKIKKREEWCRKWVFGEMARKMHKGVAERPGWRVPGCTRGKFVVPIHVMVPFDEPERILSLANDRSHGERNRRGGDGEGPKWAVEKFRDVWSHARPEDAMELWKLVRAGGVKRLLEVDSSDEEEGDENSGSGRRPMKKLKGLRNGKERERSETPLPPLPVAMEDLPVMPPSAFSIQENWRERSFSETLYEGSLSPTAIGHSSPPPPTYSPPATGKGVGAGNVPSWLLEGDWLELARTSRFENVV